MEQGLNFPLPTRHLTREIIDGFFGREKVLRTLTGEEHEAYRNTYQEDVRDYISLTIDFGPYEENGRWGIKHHVLDTVLIQPVYDSMVGLDTGFSSHGYYKMGNDGHYGLATASWYKGVVVLQPLYDDILTWKEYAGDGDEYLDESFIVRYRDKVGLVSGDKLVLEPVYDRITYNKSGIITEKEGKYGLRVDDKTIPAIYDEIRIPQTLGWIKARLGDTWGYFDVHWRFTQDMAKAYQMKDLMEHELDDFPVRKKFMFEAFCSWMDDETYIQDGKDGNLPDDIQYLGEDYLPDHDWPKPVFNKWSYFKTRDGIGLYHSLTGQIMIPAVYDELWRNSPYGVYIYKKRNKYGIVAYDGTDICPPVYDEVREVDGLWWGLLVRTDNRWDYIDWSAERYPLEPKYDEIRVNDNGLLLKKEDKVGYYFCKYVYDHPSVPAVYEGIYVPEVAGWIRVCKDGVWGYLDKDNRFTTEPSEAFAYYED